MPSGIESWRRRGNSAKSTGRTPLEEERRSQSRMKRITSEWPTSLETKPGVPSGFCRELLL